MFNPHSGTPALVRELGNGAAHKDLNATIVGIEGKRLTLRCAAASLTPGAAVRADAGGGLFLGEVVQSDVQTGQITMIVDQVIPSLPDLARLMESLCANAWPASQTGNQRERAAVPLRSM